MILGYYAGYLETDLDKSFRYVAWGSQYSGWIQFDPIFGCISHFLKHTQLNGIWIQTPYVRFSEKYDWNQLLTRQVPYIFVLGGEAGELELEQIIEHVAKNGSNLVFLFSNDIWTRAREHSEGPAVERFFNGFYRLVQLTPTDVSHGHTVNFGNGKIFFIDAEKISDALVEPGPFEAWSVEKTLSGVSALDEIIKRISIFSGPYLDCRVRGIPATWPRDESIIFEVEIRNNSATMIEDIVINLSLHPGLEPMSLINLQLDKLKPNSARTVTCLVVPRGRGRITDPIAVELEYNGHKRHVHLEPIELEVLDPLPKLLRTSKPYSVDLHTVLSAYEPYFEPVVSADTLLNLISVDPGAVVQKARQVGEYIARKIASIHLGDYKEKWDFATVSSELYKCGEITAKSKGYIDTVRIIGNLASHPSGTSFVQEDAITVCQALVLFLDECQAKF